MRPRSFMLIAGEASGDMLGAELVRSLRRQLAAWRVGSTGGSQPLDLGLAPRFFGAGGAEMQEAGVEIDVDLTRHSVIGLAEALRKFLQFHRIFRRLFRLALARQPEVIIGIDFSGFNRRFARAIQNHVRSRPGTFHNWHPKIVQYVSPQVWASRPGRALAMAKDYDLVLSLFPFEPAWYANHAPGLRVEFVGHPILERYQDADLPTSRPRSAESRKPLEPPLIVLLPGSRRGEIKRHAGPVLGAARYLAERKDVQFCVIAPNDELADRLERHPRLRAWPGAWQRLRLQVGGLAENLSQASLAIASTGTVTLECALFGVPTVALYKTSWSTYQIGKRIIRVKHLAMPNILAGETLFPEFIQQEATPRKVARAALELLESPNHRFHIKRRLAEIIRSLGGPGASDRAAEAILGLFSRA